MTDELAERRAKAKERQKSIVETIRELTPRLELKHALSPDELNYLGPLSVVKMYNGLAWQVFMQIDLVNHWSNTQDGVEYDLTSEELFLENRSEPLDVLFQGDEWP